jgi:chemotaxis-related protein WspD
MQNDEFKMGRAGALVADLELTPLGETAARINDCWNTIGVGGNGTCGELQKYIHCRNCPVYSKAGIQLLDRPMTAGYRCERTGHYAAAKALTRPARVSVVIFRIGAEWLALPTLAFQEVAPRRAVHTLPHRRGGLALGLVNIRGELLVCVSLGRLLGLELGSGAEAARLLVTNWEGQRLAIPVDAVAGIHRLHGEEVQAPPATISKSAQSYTRGVFGWSEGPGGMRRSVGYLEPEAMFNALNRSLR